MKKSGRVNKNYPSFPLELMYISAELDRKKIKNRFIDLWGDNKDLKDIIHIIKKTKILVLSSAPSYLYWRDGTISTELPKEKIKIIRKINPNLKIILIGPHPTTTPKHFLNWDLDYLIRGEPGLVTANLIENLFKGKNIKLNGVCFKKNNKWFINNSFAIVENINNLPEVPYHKIKLENYPYPILPGKSKIKKVAFYEFSRGCPYNCIFCFRDGFRGKYRTKSITKVKKELKALKDLGVGGIYFIDETFGYDKKKAKLVLKELQKHKIYWGCETRPELLDKEFIEMISKSYCYDVNIGLESADPLVLKKIGKGTIDLEKLKRDIFFLAKKNIRTHLFLIFGCPDETKKSISNTLNYISKLPLHKTSVTVGLMIPYPGTPLWYMGLKQGKKLVEWKNLEEFEGTIGNSFDNQSIQKEFILFFLKIKKMTTKSQLKNFKGDFKNYLNKEFSYSVETISSLILNFIPKIFFRKKILFNFFRKLYYLYYN